MKIYPVVHILAKILSGHRQVQVVTVGVMLYCQCIEVALVDVALWAWVIFVAVDNADKRMLRFLPCGSVYFFYGCHLGVFDAAKLQLRFYSGIIMITVLIIIITDGDEMHNKLINFALPTSPSKLQPEWTR